LDRVHYGRAHESTIFIKYGSSKARSSVEIKTRKKNFRLLIMAVRSRSNDPDAFSFLGWHRHEQSTIGTPWPVAKEVYRDLQGMELNGNFPYMV
jgi:hypothetical protein